jgi:hypothetical protein
LCPSAPAGGRACHHKRACAGAKLLKAGQPARASINTARRLLVGQGRAHRAGRFAVFFQETQVVIGIDSILAQQLPELAQAQRFWLRGIEGRTRHFSLLFTAPLLGVQHEIAQRQDFRCQFRAVTDPGRDNRAGTAASSSRYSCEPR